MSKAYPFFHVCLFQSPPQCLITVLVKRIQIVPSIREEKKNRISLFNYNFFLVKDKAPSYIAKNHDKVKTKYIASDVGIRRYCSEIVRIRAAVPASSLSLCSPNGDDYFQTFTHSRQLLWLLIYIDICKGEGDIKTFLTRGKRWVFRWLFGLTIFKECDNTRAHIFMLCT